MKNVILIYAVAGALGALLCIAARAEYPDSYILEKEIKFLRHYNSHSMSNQTPNLRVNLDLSLDGGSNWHKRIAHGIPAEWGTNSYMWSFQCTPAMWTTNARVGVRTLWYSTTNKLTLHYGDMSDSSFTIPGVRILAPTNNERINQPSYKTIRWHEVGYDYVTIAISSNACTNWTPLYRVPSSALTNTYSLPIIGMPTGRVDLMIWAQTDLYHTVQMNIRQL